MGIGERGKSEMHWDTAEPALDLASRASEAHFRATFEQVAVGIAHTSPDGRWLRMNRRFCEILGYAEADLRGKHFMELVHGPDLAEELKGMALIGLGDIDHFRRELRYVHKNGTPVWVQLTVSLVYLTAGEPEYYVSVLEDISARKSAEALQQLHERALDACANGVFILSEDGRVQYVNPAYLRISGLSIEQVLGREAESLFQGAGPVSLEEIRSLLRAQREGRTVISSTRPDAEPSWTELLLTPVRDERGEVNHFVGVLNEITEQKRYEERLLWQSHHDTLTGLPNRVLLQERLNLGMAYANRSGRLMAVLFIDLDHFKLVNDSLGHELGDRLLQQVGERLSGLLRESDTVARQGGDEFVVILSELKLDEHAGKVCQKLLDALTEPFEVEGRTLRIAASVGIALYPRDAEDTQNLLRFADTALYRAKELGRNNFQFFTDAMNARMLERLVLESGLHQAVANDELLLHYQPQVELDNGRVLGAEALLRWRHPHLGLVAPNRFIAIAEETGLIIPIGDWVLRRACADAMRWQGLSDGDFRIAVNLSACQFRDVGLVGRITAILEDTGLPPACLELEITESLLLQDVDAAIASLRELKALGISLSMDDFGTGYSSLSYLKRLPIDRLKIDQSFVRELATNPEDAAITRAIISMAHNLNLSVIAEGVETEAQRSLLVRYHCDELQGFLFSRPVEAQALYELLVTRLTLSSEPTNEEGRTLLLVDDEESVLSALARALRREGYRILKASSVAEAFELLARYRVGVVVSDQRMPEGSGIEFLRKVKQIHPETVRIVLSGYTELKSVVSAINEGSVYKFLTKPWEDEQLRAEIREAFHYYELAEENAHLRQLVDASNMPALLRPIPQQ